MTLDIYFLVQKSLFRAETRLYWNCKKVTVGLFPPVYFTQVVSFVGDDVMVLFDMVVFVVVVM